MRTMKYLLPFLMMAFMCACSSSSDEPVIENEKPKEVTFYVNFEFEGKSMTRSSSDAYADFYENNIKNKKLIPDDYTISFTNEETGTRYDFKGKWSQKDKITLLEGKYKVNGASRTSKVCSDMASIIFNNEIEVKDGMSELVLEANYECCLLMFNKSNIVKLNFSYSNNLTPLFEYKDYYYCFGVNLSSSSSNSIYFKGERDNGSTFSFKVGENIFEPGKYYFFNDTKSSFDIPEMEAGN